MSCPLTSGVKARPAAALKVKGQENSSCFCRGRRNGPEQSHAKGLDYREEQKPGAIHAIHLIH